MNDMRC